MGEIFDKLRIQGRMHILGQKWKSRFDIEFGIYATNRDEPRLAPPDLLSASSYGRNKFRIEFWSQCHIFRFGNNRKSSKPKTVENKNLIEPRTRSERVINITLHCIVDVVGAALDRF